MIEVLAQSAIRPITETGQEHKTKHVRELIKQNKVIEKRIITDQMKQQTARPLSA
jgi:hypothetical protein